LFNSSMLLKIYQSFEYSMQCCNITSIQHLSQLKLQPVVMYTIQEGNLSLSFSLPLESNFLHPVS